MTLTDFIRNIENVDQDAIIFQEGNGGSQF